VGSCITNRNVGRETLSHVRLHQCGVVHYCMAVLIEFYQFNVGLIFYMFDYVWPYIACIFTNVGQFILTPTWGFESINFNVGLNSSYFMN